MRMINRAASFFLLIITCALAVSCATAPRSVPAASPKPSDKAPAVQSPAQTPAPQAKPSETPSAQSPPTKANDQNELVRKGSISVTEAFYKQTLTDIRNLIGTLNTIIGNEDFETWLTYLTPQYKQTFSNPDTLSSLSDMPLLQKHDVQLHSLQDYFLYVVVPSRSDARVDDIDFLSRNHVRAIAIISGQRYILYDLQLVNGSWKIGVS